MRLSIMVIAGSILLGAGPAVAQETSAPIHDAIALAFSGAPGGPVNPQSPTPRQVAFEYSDAYRTRAKIHKAAAIATLPLFAAEYYLGQSIYHNSSSGKKSAHIAIGTGIVGLYSLQAVTGVWNLVDAHKDPNGRKRRLVHGILMLASGAGFAVTPMVAPGERDFRVSGTSGASTHRAVAFTSIGIGTAGYLMMLIGGR